VFTPLVRRLIAIAGVAAAVGACVPASATAQGHSVVWAVGDAQASDLARQDAVASMIQTAGLQRLLFLGDLTERGTAQQYATDYGPTYGRLKAVTSPTIGNHDWARRAQGYGPYWGAGVQQPGGGHWYSFDLGGWHFVSLSSMEERGPGSAQLAWLEADLARYSGTCTIAFTHFPRYSAGPQWSNASLEPLWRALRGHAVLFLSAHAHNYQRHKPVRGITQFVVGTGGGTFGHPDYWDPRLVSKADRYLGALRLELAIGGGRFGFLSTDGVTRDSGNIGCVPHSPTPATIRTRRPANRERYRALKTLYGRVRNATRVRLTLVRRAGGRCVAWDGERFRGASCKTRLSFPVTTLKAPPFPGTGTYRWKYKLPSASTLSPGGYRLDVQVRALDRSLAKRATRFRIRR
jgi:hypothetical protein